MLVRNATDSLITYRITPSLDGSSAPFPSPLVAVLLLPDASVETVFQTGVNCTLTPSGGSVVTGLIVRGGVTDAAMQSEVTDATGRYGVTDAAMQSGVTDATIQGTVTDAAMRGYVVLDLTESVLYDDYDIALTVHNYTGDVVVYTSRHVAVLRFAHP